MESIFYYIEKCKPLKDMDPQENFLTQIFAWILMQNESFRCAFIKYLSKLYNGDNNFVLFEPVSIDTQVSVSCSDGSTGYIDMLIDDGETYLIFEHKVSSRLSDNQIDKYVHSADFLGKKVISVLITLDRKQFEQDADISITWREVHRFVSKDFLRMNKDLMVIQLEQYFRDTNMGCDEPFTRQEIQELLGDQYSDKLTRLFRWIETDLKHDKEIVESLSKIDPDHVFHRAPYKRENRWNRIGINCLSNESVHWNPGLFIGVLCSDKDHGISPLHKEQGPDFFVCLEMDEENPERAKFVQSQEYKNMVGELRTILGEDYSFIEATELRYRVLVIRKPFAEVITKADSWDEQYENVRYEVKRMIKAVSESFSKYC